MPLLDAFASASFTAMDMPLFDCSLPQFFKSQPTGTNTAYNSVARSVAQGLAHMHGKGILHLNLHANCVMLKQNGRRPQGMRLEFRHGGVDDMAFPGTIV